MDANVMKAWVEHLSGDPCLYHMQQTHRLGPIARRCFGSSHFDLRIHGRTLRHSQVTRIDPRHI